jgi:hypothetical protein
MNRFLTIRRLSILFFAVFGVLCLGAFALQHWWLEPGARCEESGRWWDPEGRICAQPLSIAEITGRPIGKSRAEASNAGNRELVRVENRLEAERAARDADAAVQRRRLAEVEGN